jgi:hypothetical protein
MSDWSDWFGDYATKGSAKRAITMIFTGPKVSDRDNWIDSEVRQTPEGKWQVRVLEAEFVSTMRIG